MEPRLETERSVGQYDVAQTVCLLYRRMAVGRCEIDRSLQQFPTSQVANLRTQQTASLRY